MDPFKPRLKFEEVLPERRCYWFKTALNKEKEEETTLNINTRQNQAFAQLVRDFTLTVSGCINLLRKLLYIDLKPLLYLSNICNCHFTKYPTQYQGEFSMDLWRKIKLHTWLRTSESEADATKVMARPLVPNLPALPTYAIDSVRLQQPFQWEEWSKKFSNDQYSGFYKYDYLPCVDMYQQNLACRS